MFDPEAATRLDVALARLRTHNTGRHLTGSTHEDADEAQGTLATDDAIGFDPWPLLRALHLRACHAVVMGQVAGILHGSEELTGDLDLLWTGEPGQRDGMALALSDVGAQLTDGNGEHVMGNPFDLPKILFRSPCASGDLCTPELPWGDLPVREFIARSDTTIDAYGTVIRYVSLPDLVVMRRVVGRAKDLRRAVELEQLGDVRSK
jgi:hypothetical protein